jgi:hypothetical protein
MDNQLFQLFNYHRNKIMDEIRQIMSWAHGLRPSHRSRMIDQYQNSMAQLNTPQEVLSRLRETRESIEEERRSYGVVSLPDPESFSPLSDYRRGIEMESVQLSQSRYSPENTYYDEIFSTAKKRTKAISPQEYFSAVKKQFKEISITKEDEKEVAIAKKALVVAHKNGQTGMAKKIARVFADRFRTGDLLAAGVKYWVDKESLYKFKTSIQGGHISDTRFEDYTRLIPDEVVTIKKKVEEFFDKLIIFHYWNEKAVETEMMSPTEYSAMKDPILFGVSNDTPDKYYVIADWEDDYCNLKFDDVVKFLGGDKEKFKLK